MHVVVVLFVGMHSDLNSQNGKEGGGTVLGLTVVGFPSSCRLLALCWKLKMNREQRWVRYCSSIGFEYTFTIYRGLVSFNKEEEKLVANLHPLIVFGEPSHQGPVLAVSTSSPLMKWNNAGYGSTFLANKEGKA